MDLIRIGTRGSLLALYQAELTQSLLQQVFPALKIEIVKIKTTGDVTSLRGSDPFETKRIFTREIEESLLSGQVDIAVHSAKDMAVPLPKGLTIGCVLEREDPRDCLISRTGRKLADLPAGAKIGTSSLRRKRQVKHQRPDLEAMDIHGNVDTRIRKVEEGVYEAVVLAFAGVKRLGLTSKVTEIFPENIFYPAPGQGIIAIECREQDAELLDLLKQIGHKDTAYQLECERAFLKRLEGGCQLPCGISTRIDGKNIKLQGILYDTTNLETAQASLEVQIQNAEKAGQDLAETILKNGGQKILERIRYGQKK